MSAVNQPTSGEDATAPTTATLDPPSATGGEPKTKTPEQQIQQFFASLADQLKEEQEKLQKLASFRKEIKETGAAFSTDELQAVDTAVADQEAVVQGHQRALGEKIRRYRQDIQAVEALIAQRQSVLQTVAADEALRVNGNLMTTLVARQRGLLDNLEQAKQAVFGEFLSSQAEDSHSINE